tara:strand:- start:659 stop:763 length:105 start_codon:yes stop_codon:yes gene_type:complete
MFIGLNLEKLIFFDASENTHKEIEDLENNIFVND